MKTLFWIGSFIIVGLSAGFIVGFGIPFGHQHIVPDEEQTGMKEEIIIKFSHVVAENTPKGLAAQHFADLVEQATNGKVKIEVFPNSSLYSDQDELAALQSGDVQIIAPAFSKFTAIVPQWYLFDLPFAFSSDQEVNKAVSGAIGKTIFAKMQKQNFKVLGVWENGFKQITSNRGPIEVPDDFKGQSFRIMPSKVIQAQFQALDATAKMIPFNQTYSNLQNGSIDGEENTISNIYSKKLYQVQKYMTISNHGYLGYAVVMNLKYWNSLPANVKTVIQKAMNETSVWNRKHANQINQDQLRKIRNKSSIRIHVLTPKEKKLWIRKLQPVYQQFAKVIGEKLMKEWRQYRTN